MILKTMLPLLCMSSCLLGAQGSDRNPAYFRVGVLASDGEMKDYLGNRRLGQTYELGYTFDRPGQRIGLGVYANYIVAHGDAIPAYQGLKQALFGWRLGLDSRFSTPLQGLTPYLGLAVTSWDGRRTAGGTVPNLDNPGSPYVLKQGGYAEGKGKLGARIGVEYRFTPTWGMALDYNFSDWLWDNGGVNAPTGNRAVLGVNPVRPSWFGLSVQYRWTAFKD